MESFGHFSKLAQDVDGLKFWSDHMKNVHGNSASTQLVLKNLRGKRMKCKICSEETAGKIYCPLHNEAYKNIVNKFERWQKALDISWKEYLSEIANNALTGKAAKETADHLLKIGEK